MELADIEAALANAENIPVLGGIVHDLRECVQIMTEIPVNSQVMTDQATDLGNVFKDGTNLLNEFNNTLNELRQTGKWQGPAADDYLGPPGSRGPSSGAGGQLLSNMHQIIGTVKANQIAHTNSANFINEVNVLQIVLWGEVVVAVVTVLAIIAATASVVGAPADAGLVPAAGIETATATGTAGTIATMTTTTTTLSTSVEAVIAQAEAQLAAAYAMQAVSGMLVLYGSVLAADVGLAFFEITLVNNADQGTPTSLSPTPDPLTPDQEAEIQRILTKCPWASRSYIEWLVRQNISEASIEQLLEILQPILPSKWADFEELAEEFPGCEFAIARLLAAGYTKDQIRQMFSALIARFGASAIQNIAGDPNKSYAIEYLYVLINVPGIDNIVNSLVSAKYAAAKISGDLFELEWMSSNLQSKGIIRVQLPATGTDGKPKQGPDAELADGTLIQIKTYQWDSRYYTLPFAKTGVENDLASQVEVTVRNYPGHPITFVFNSRFGPVPDWVKTKIQELERQYHVQINVEEYP